MAIGFKGIKFSGRIPKVTGRTRNIARSLGYATMDVFSQYNPTLSNIHRETRKLVSDTKSSMKKMATAKPDSSSNDTLKDIIKDFKSGNWYNKDKELGSFDDDNIGNDEDWGDEVQTSSPEDSGSFSTKAVLNSMTNLSSNLSNNLGMTNIKSAQYIVQANAAGQKASYEMTVRGFNQVSSILLSINQKLDVMVDSNKIQMISFQNQNQFYIRATNFFDDTTRSLQNIGASLERIAGNTDVLGSTPGGRYNDKRRTIDTLLFGGEFSFSSYVDLIKENVKEQTDLYKSIYSLAKDSSSRGSSGKLSPLGIALKMAIDSAIPTVLKSSMEAFNKNISNSITITLERVAQDLSSNGGIGNILRKIFLPDTLIGKASESVKFNRGNYNKGAVAWDGIARKSLVEVIPTYLAKINAALGGEEKYFDYEKGKFVNAYDIHQILPDKMNKAAKSAGGKFRKDIIKKAESSGLSDEIKEEIDAYFRAAFEYGTDFSNVKERKTDTTWLRKMGISKETADLISSVAGGYKSGKDTAKLTEFMAAIAIERNKYADDIKKEEAKGYSPLSNISNGFSNEFATSNATLTGIYQTVGDIYALLLSGGGGGRRSKVKSPRKLFDIKTGKVVSYAEFKENEKAREEARKLYEEDRQRRVNSEIDLDLDYIDRDLEYEAKEDLKKGKKQIEDYIDKVLGNDDSESSGNGKKSFGKKLKSTLYSGYKNVKSFYKTVKSIYEKPFTAIAGVLDTFSGSIASLFWGTSNNKGLIEKIGDKINTIFDDIKGKLSNKTKDILGNFFKIFGGLGNAVKDEAKNVGNKFRNIGYKFFTGKTYDHTMAKKYEETGDEKYKEAAMRHYKDKHDRKTGESGGASGIKKSKKKQKSSIPGWDEGGLFGFLKEMASEAVSGAKKGYSILTKGIPEDKAKEKITENINKILSEANDKKGAVGLGALAGAGLSLAGTITLGPLLGAGLGAGLGLISKSKTIQKLLFGQKDRESDKDYEKSLRGRLNKFFTKQYESVGIGATIGTVAGAFLGSPVLGAIAGASIGFVKTSSEAQELLFGTVDKNGKHTKLLGEILDNIKARLPKVGIGATAGALLGIAGPFGIVGSMILGASIGYISDEEEFKDYMFGERDENGNISDEAKSKSLTGLIREKIVYNLDDIHHNTLNMLTGFGRILTIKINKLFDNIGRKLMRIIRPGSKMLDDFMRRTLGFGFSTLGKGVKGATNLVGGALDKVNTGMKNINLKYGFDVYDRNIGRNLSAQERNRMREEHKLTREDSEGNSVGIGDYSTGYAIDKGIGNATDAQLIDLEEFVKGIRSSRMANIKFQDQRFKGMYEDLLNKGVSVDRIKGSKINDYLRQGKVDKAIKHLQDSNILGEANIDDIRTILNEASSDVRNVNSKDDLNNRIVQLLNDQFGIKIDHENKEEAMATMLNLIKTEKDFRGINGNEKMVKEVAEQQRNEDDFRASGLGLLDEIRYAVDKIAGLEAQEGIIKGKYTTLVAKSRIALAAKEASRGIGEFTKEDIDKAIESASDTELEEYAKIIFKRMGYDVADFATYAKNKFNNAKESVIDIAGDVKESAIKTAEKVKTGAINTAQNMAEFGANVKNKVGNFTGELSNEINEIGIKHKINSKIRSKAIESIKEDKNIGLAAETLGFSVDEMAEAIVDGDIDIDYLSRIMPEEDASELVNKGKTKGIKDVINNAKAKVKEVTYDSLGGVHQHTINNQGESVEDTSDAETKKSIAEMKRFKESIFEIPILGGALNKLSGLFGSIKDGLFGSKEEGKKGIFDILGEKLFGENGVLSGLFNWFTGTKFGGSITSVLSQGIVPFAKNLLVEALPFALIAAATAGAFDGIANNINSAFGRPNNEGGGSNENVTTSKDKKGNTIYKVNNKWYYTNNPGENDKPVDDNDVDVSSITNKIIGPDTFSTRFKKNFLRGTLTGTGSATGFLLSKFAIGKAASGAMSKVMAAGGKTGRVSLYKTLGSIATNKDAAMTVVGMANNSLEGILIGIGNGLKHIPFLKNVDVDGMMAKLYTNLTKNMTTEAAQGIASTASTALRVLKVALIFTDFTTGFQDARTTLGITEEPTIGQRMLSGVLRVVKNSVPFIGTLIPDAALADIIVEFIAPVVGMQPKELMEQRARADEEVAAYNTKHGTDLSKEEYIKQVLNDKTWTEELSEKTKTTFSKVSATFAKITSGKSSTEDIINDFKAIGDDLTTNYVLGRAFKFFTQGDIVGLFTLPGNIWEEEKDPINKFIKGVPALLSTIGLAGPTLLSWAGHKVWDGISGVIKSIQNGFNTLKSEFEYGQKLMTSDKDTNFSDLFKFKDEDPDNPMGGIQKTILVTARMIGTGSVILKYVGKRIWNDYISPAIEKVKTGFNSFVDNSKALLGKVADGNPLELMTYGTGLPTDTSDNPVGLFMNGVLAIEKLFLFTPSIISFGGHFIYDNIISPVIDSTVKTFNAVKDKSGELFGKVADGDFVGVLTYNTVVGEGMDALNPMSMLGTAIMSTEKIIATPVSALSMVGHTIMNVFNAIKEKVANMQSTITKSTAEIENQAAKGNLEGVWSVEIKDDEGNPVGFVPKAVGFVTKLINSGVAVFNWAKAGINNFITGISNDIDTDRKNLDTAVANMERNSKDGKFLDVANEKGPEFKSVISGIYKVSFFFTKIINTITGVFHNITGSVENIWDKVHNLINGSSDEDNESAAGSGLSGGSSGFVNQYDSGAGEKGCGPAVASMAASALGKNLSVSSAVSQSQRYKNSAGVDASYFGDVFSKSGIDTNYITGPNRNQQILNSLNSGNKVVLLGQRGGSSGGMTKAESPFGPNNHYVLATGYDRDGIIINDPELKGPVKYPWGILDNVKMGISAGATGLSASQYQMATDRNAANIRTSNGNAPKSSGLAGVDEGIAQQVYAFFTSKGYTPAAAAGILGNMYQESHVNPKAIQGGGKGPAAGIVQWESIHDPASRYGKMKAYAESKGKDWTDLGSQLEYIDMELPGLNAYFQGKGKAMNNLNKAGATPTTFEEWKKSTDAIMATNQFEGAFERGGKPAMDNRRKAAAAFYNAYSGSTIEYDPSKYSNGVGSTGSTGTTAGEEEVDPFDWKNNGGLLGLIGNISAAFTNAFSGKKDTSKSLGSTTSSDSSEKGSSVGSSNMSGSPSEIMESKLGQLTYSQSGPRDPDKGSADCSSTVRWAILKAGGPDIGGNTAAQYNNSGLTTVAYNNGSIFNAIPSEAQKDDILFFSRPNSGFTAGIQDRVGHVGIYMGNNKYIDHGGPGKGTNIKNGPGKNLIKVSRVTGLGTGVSDYDGSSGASSSSSGKGKEKNPGIVAKNTNSGNVRYDDMIYEKEVNPALSPSQYQMATKTQSIPNVGNVYNSGVVASKAVNYTETDAYKNKQIWDNILQDFGKSNLDLKNPRQFSFTGGSSGLFDNASVINSSKTSETVKVDIPKINPKGGVDANLVNKLVESLAKLLGSIADNTAPIEKIYEILSKNQNSTAVGAGSEAQHSTKPDDNVIAASRTSRISNNHGISDNLINLTGILAQISKG